MAKILVVEDDLPLSTGLCFELDTSGYLTVAAYNCQKALKLIKIDHFDLAILDINLPDGDGFELCREIKKEQPQLPVLFLTAKDLEQDVLKGFDLGADDYIMKPFDSKEMVARVKAVLRRYQPAKTESHTENPSKKVEYPGLVINLTNYSVLVDGKNADMPPKELELLYFLASSPNQVFTREQLLDHIWGYEYIGDTRTVDVHIKRLREKIGDHAAWNLGTVWGIGYKFEVK